MIGKLGYPFGGINDAGIASVEPAYVRPIFVQFRHHRTRHDRTRDIAAATRKRFDFLIKTKPVKTRDHRFFIIFQYVCRDLERLFVQNAVLIKAHELRRIDKRHVEHRRHDFRREIFPTRSAIITTRPAKDLLFDLVKGFLHTQFFTDFRLDI